MPGFSPRWSEHVRELQLQISGKTDNRGRRRYKVLQHHQSSSCLNLVVLCRAPTSTICAYEALAIARTCPPSNGHELKHFQEQFRKLRNRTGRTRARVGESTRRLKRQADLKLGREQWGLTMRPLPACLMMPIHAISCPTSLHTRGVRKVRRAPAWIWRLLSTSCIA